MARNLECQQKNLAENLSQQTTERIATLSRNRLSAKIRRFKAKRTWRRTTIPDLDMTDRMKARNPTRTSTFKTCYASCYLTMRECETFIWAGLIVRKFKLKQLWQTKSQLILHHTRRVRSTLVWEKHYLQNAVRGSYGSCSGYIARTNSFGANKGSFPAPWLGVLKTKLWFKLEHLPSTLCGQMYQLARGSLSSLYARWKQRVVANGN